MSLINKPYLSPYHVGVAAPPTIDGFIYARTSADDKRYPYYVATLWTLSGPFTLTVPKELVLEGRVQN